MRLYRLINETIWKKQKKGECYISKIIKEDKGTLQDGPRVNEEITSSEVRLVDENGEMVGVVSLKQALERAFAAGLDLVEVSPNADPPVCKILNHGKFKYEEQKRRAEIRKKQKIIEIKEIQLRPGIDKHDFEVKMRSARKFIDEGDKLKVTLRFRGRELSHQELGMEVLNRVKDALQDIAKVEQFPKLEGKRVIMVMGPVK
jgi:translation initiation factor IF-3